MEVARRAAEAGALVIRESLEKPSVVKFKGTTDLVTETDIASEKAILEVDPHPHPVILVRCPRCPFLIGVLNAACTRRSL